ncbi:MAG: hypothetical protein ACK5M7_11375, partial [Draconibacterium sp.]
TVSLAFELRDKLLKISWIFLNLVHVSKINLYLTKRDKQFKKILQEAEKCNRRLSAWIFGYAPGKTRPVSGGC